MKASLGSKKTKSRKDDEDEDEENHDEDESVWILMEVCKRISRQELTKRRPR